MSNETQPTVTLDINVWTYAEYMNFASLWAQNKVEEAMRYAMKIVVAWGYDVSLDIPQPDAELGYLDLVAVVKAINARIEAFGETVDFSDVKVDLNRWKSKDFYSFQKAIRNLDFKVMENLLKKASSQFSSDESALSFVDGVKLSKAVADRQKELFRKG